MVLQKIANTVRHLVVDTIEMAGAGHPGLPMGCAELGAYLYAKFLKYDPRYPKWPQRDRLILSAGHGSLLLYSCLHLAGFPLSIHDLKNFRQLNSKTPSHPDLHQTEGIEASTGVDGQGIGFAVGQALALKLSKINSKVVCLAGDGCLMEGVSSEVCSLAGHLNLNNLILIYDSNKTTLDGYVSESFSENIFLRFKAQGWDVTEINGHNLGEIDTALSPLRNLQEKPTLIIAHTKIGYGSSKAGTPAVHGKPLGKKEVSCIKKALGLPDTPFYVDPEIYSFFQSRPSLGTPISLPQIPNNLEQIIEEIAIPPPISGRWASHEVLQILADHLPFLIVGSADLSSSDATFLKAYGTIQPNHFEERNIKYGVREFGMGCIASGLAQTELFFPVVGTFLAFVDYLKSAIRMTALMHLKVIYHLSHDSFFIGSDGPTHQPVEQIASLRAIPNLLVIRPADAHEVKMGWLAALKHHGPTAMILSKQPLPMLPHYPDEGNLLLGAYIVQKEKQPSIDYLLIATGSEVHLALKVAKLLGPAARVVSMPSWELFEKQPLSYRQNLLQGKLKISIEAGVHQGWHKYIGSDGLAISIDTFGSSGPADTLAIHFGFTPEKIVEKIRVFLQNK